MAYANYTYYVTTYLGSAIAEEDFPAFAFRASAVIDQITFNRAASETVVATVNAIKNAMCAIAEELQRQDLGDGVDGVASESQGQYSVSYLATSDRSKSNQAKVETAAKLYLGNTGLMFAGFYTDEYGGVLK